MSYLETPGYQPEFHRFETEDHYILTLTRIKSFPRETHEVEGTVQSENQNTKPPVVIVHGFLCSSDQWLINSPEKVLPYRLLNEGYDCWLANLRGTPLSKGHTKLPTNSKKYWDFSIHEIAQFDLPAIIDYILETTGNKSLYYVGHSMGCSVFFAGMSLRPELCSKITAMVALAPAMHGSHIKNKFFRPVFPFGNLIGKSKFLTRREIFGKTLAESCRTFFPWKRDSPKMGSKLIKTFVVRFGAFGNDQIEKERLSIISANWPAPTSMKLFCHGVQVLTSGVARQYDYGRSGNLKAYGQVQPPAYEFNKINVPVAMFYSDCDELCTPRDVIQLSTEIPNLIELNQISQPDFSHIDFVLGKDVNNLVYDRVIQVIREGEIAEVTRL